MLLGGGQRRRVDQRLRQHCLELMRGHAPLDVADRQLDCLATVAIGYMQIELVYEKINCTLAHSTQRGLRALASIGEEAVLLRGDQEFLSGCRGY